MKPPFSVIFFTTLAGMGQGLFLLLALTQLLTDNYYPSTPIFAGGGIITFILLFVGMIASIFHLGHPERAWRAVSQWRTSWLSREVIVLPVLIGLVVVYSAGNLFPQFTLQVFPAKLMTVITLAGIVFALLLFVCTGMVYASLKFMQEWHSPLVVLNFILLGFSSGFLLAALVGNYYQFAYSELYLYCAIASLVFALINRGYLLWRNQHLRPISTVQSAIGINNPQIRQISSGAIAPTFNRQQFNHGKTYYFIRSIKWLFLVAVFVVPLLLMLFYSVNQVGWLLFVGLVVQYLGLIGERWYFFAEVNHPQNIYYQVIA